MVKTYMSSTMTYAIFEEKSAGDTYNRFKNGASGLGAYSSISFGTLALVPWQLEILRHTDEAILVLEPRLEKDIQDCLAEDEEEEAVFYPCHIDRTQPESFGHSHVVLEEVEEDVRGRSFDQIIHSRQFLGEVDTLDRRGGEVDSFYLSLYWQ
jgi:hypothetical protein